MKRVNHKQQIKKWEEEHKNPFSLKQMDSKKASNSVKEFYKFLASRKKQNLVGVEMCSGKARNSIYLSKQKFIKKIYAFDFSKNAIIEAKKRAKVSKIGKKLDLYVADATKKWKQKNNSIDFVVDCTGLCDIESEILRKKASSQVFNVLKPGGYLLIYVMSEEDEFHKQMIKKSPGIEKFSFVHELTGKYEKVFLAKELDLLYKKFILIEERRIEKNSEFFGKKYFSKMHWRIYQKPIK